MKSWEKRLKKRLRRLLKDEEGNWHLPPWLEEELLDLPPTLRAWIDVIERLVRTTPIDWPAIREAARKVEKTLKQKMFW